MRYAIALLLLGCNHSVYCWRATEMSAPHCYETRELCQGSLLGRTFEQIREQRINGWPDPVCMEEAR